MQHEGYKTFFSQVHSVSNPNATGLVFSSPVPLRKLVRNGGGGGADVTCGVEKRES
jgi:hypothetical protein